ncbi:MAG: hypothetical protein KF819_13565 [Labilithrix sp.]|nr:hypothetical protein [Labilithrix sp.]
MLLRHAWVGLVCVFLSLGGEARASPAHAHVKSAEERLIDGDIDVDDLVGRATVGRAVLPRAPGGDTWVSLVGYAKETAIGERELGGMVVVGLPLDRIVRVSARPSTGAGAAAAAATDGDAALAMTPKLARACVAEAWRAAGVAVDDGRLDTIVSRARWAALLPEARLRAIRYADERLYTDATGDVSRLRDSAGANLGLEARLTWRFDRLLYADDEPSFERMRLDRHDARTRIAAKVLDALFHWQRAWLELRWAQAASREAREAPGRSRDEIEAALRVMEAEATLDVLTSGWFSTWRSQRVTLVSPIPSRAEQGL